MYPSFLHFKIDRHDLTEILLKVELNTINLNKIYSSMIRPFLGVIALFHSEYFINKICTGNSYILNLNLIKTSMLAIMICKLLLVIEWTILKEILPFLTKNILSKRLLLTSSDNLSRISSKVCMLAYNHI